MTFKKYKVWLFNVIIFLWFIPLIKGLIPASINIKPKPLTGYFPAPIDQPTFSWESWYDGTFQQLSEKYIEERLGFRPFFIRLRNQIDFSLFKKSNAQEVIVGSDNVLYSEKYISSFTGENFIGREKITKKVQITEALQSELKKLNIDLVFVVAPGKGFFYPELLPEKFLKRKKDSTNYDWYLKAMHERHINVIDFNAYFLSQKNKSQYPLFTKTGVHWSSYGATLAGDSIIKYIEALTHSDMLNIIKESIEISDTARHTDNDISLSLNLFSTIQNPPLGYFRLAFENNPSKIKPAILTIGDSFYWNIFMDGIPQNLYVSPEFWYYSKQVYIPDRWTPVATTDLEYLKKKIFEQKVIVIVQTEANFDDFGFGFIEKAYNIVKHKDQAIIFDIPEAPNPVLKQNIENYLADWLTKRGKKRTFKEGFDLLWNEDGTWKESFKDRWVNGYIKFLNGENDQKEWDTILQQGFSDRNFATYLVPAIMWWADNG